MLHWKEKYNFHDYWKIWWKVVTGLIVLQHCTFINNQAFFNLIIIVVPTVLKIKINVPTPMSSFFLLVLSESREGRRVEFRWVERKAEKTFPNCPHYSRCIFSVLLRWANAIKIPDQHKYNKNEFLLPTECLEGVLKYSYNYLILINILSLRVFLYWINSLWSN